MAVYVRSKRSAVPLHVGPGSVGYPSRPLNRRPGSAFTSRASGDRDPEEPMTNGIGLLSKGVPMWALVAVIGMVAAGAAVGTVLGGNVQGSIPTSVSQSLLLDTVIQVDGGFGAVSDDGTQFTIAREIHTGEQYTIDLMLSNGSDDQLLAELSLDIPVGLTVDVEGVGSDVLDVTRTGLGTWRMRVESGATDESGKITITVAHADDAPPGFYEMFGFLSQTGS